MNILAILGISNAFAADTAAAAPQQGLMSMLPLFLILIAFMYFMVIRPQQKRAKDQKALLSNIKVGDEVMTSAGILGKIEKISNDFAVVSIAENVKITMQKNSVVAIVPKGTVQSVE